MKIISHRANINGSNTAKENKIQSIVKCIEKYKLDVEIDIRGYNNKIYLTHDDNKKGLLSTKKIEILKKYKKYLWVHCKNLEAIIYMQKNLKDFNYFGHSNDDFVLTSKKYIFTKPGITGGKNVICVMPELSNTPIDFNSYYGILTDNPLKFL
jgi:hypothetical protein